jgi:hypothetical protein
MSNHVVSPSAQNSTVRGRNMPAAGLPACDASHTFRTIQNDSE